MYKSFVEFKIKYLKKHKIIGKVESNSTINEIFKKWVSKLVVEEAISFDTNDCILIDFPLKEQAHLISQFVSDAYTYAWGADYQITKLIYSLWDKYMLDKDGGNMKYKDGNRSNEYHANIFESLYTIKTELKSMKNMTNNEKNMIAFKKNLNSSYLNWHLFGCLPLLKNDGIAILKNITTLNYDDAQEFIMFAIYQYPPQSFCKDLKEILLYWYAHKNILFETGTGMLYQLSLFYKKYEEHHIDILNYSGLDGMLDRDIVNIIKQHH